MSKQGPKSGDGSGVGDNGGTNKGTSISNGKVTDPAGAGTRVGDSITNGKPVEFFPNVAITGSRDWR